MRQGGWPDAERPDDGCTNLVKGIQVWYQQHQLCKVRGRMRATERRATVCMGFMGVGGPEKSLILRFTADLGLSSLHIFSILLTDSGHDSVGPKLDS